MNKINFLIIIIVFAILFLIYICSYLNKPNSNYMPQENDIEINDNDIEQNNKEIYEDSEFKNDFSIIHLNDSNVCSICLDPINQYNTYTFTKCNHLFHTECINKWFKTLEKK